MVTFSWTLYSGWVSYKLWWRRIETKFIFWISRTTHKWLEQTSWCVTARYLHSTAYSIAVWAVLKQFCSCHISVCWCLRGQQNCMCTLNVARSQSYSNWAESICRFHCILSEHTFMDDCMCSEGDDISSCVILWFVIMRKSHTCFLYLFLACWLYWSFILSWFFTLLKLFTFIYREEELG